jgi:hypothetical protein
VNKSEASRALYWERRRARRCVDCDAGLLDEEINARCLECRERCALNSRRSRAKLPKKKLKVRREKLHSRYWENVDERRARMRQDKRDRFKAGICTQCTRTRSPGSSTCDGHREVRRLESYVRYLRSENRDVTAALAEYEALKASMRQPRKPIKRAREPEQIEPVLEDEGRGRMRGRILRALRFFDWTRAGDLFIAMDLELDAASHEYNNAAVMLSRLVRLGLVEKVGPHNESDYRITDAGRAEIGALRRAA